jgi:hypothetical protein
VKATVQIDHLVVAASTLDEGVQWCERTLGVTPGPGGQHPLMGTHNRLLNLSSPAFPSVYLEVIAIDPGAPWARSTWASRWFDLDSSEVQQGLTANGPRLIHFVASTPSAADSTKALATLGLDRGPLIEASRMTPNGLLAWRITVRDDGQRLLNGTLPTLIEWQGQHPTHAMPASGVTLQSLSASHPEHGLLSGAFDALGLTSVATTHGAANLVATLNTPRGLVTLQSQGL